MKLRDLIQNQLTYWSDWGIWAELIDGEFSLDSECRMGEFQFKNGGLLDDFENFSSNEEIEDFVYGYWNERSDSDILQSDDPEYPSRREEAISQLIFEKNQELKANR